MTSPHIVVELDGLMVERRECRYGWDRKTTGCRIINRSCMASACVRAWHVTACVHDGTRNNYRPRCRVTRVIFLGIRTIINDGLQRLVNYCKAHFWPGLLLCWSAPLRRNITRSIIFQWFIITRRCEQINMHRCVRHFWKSPKLKYFSRSIRNRGDLNAGFAWLYLHYTSHKIIVEVKTFYVD